jgi:hypothetical protein
MERVFSKGTMVAHVSTAGAVSHGVVCSFSKDSPRDSKGNRLAAVLPRTHWKGDIYRLLFPAHGLEAPAHSEKWHIPHKNLLGTSSKLVGLEEYRVVKPPDNLLVRVVRTGNSTAVHWRGPMDRWT